MRKNTNNNCFMTFKFISSFVSLVSCLLLSCCRFLRYLLPCLSFLQHEKLVMWQSIFSYKILDIPHLIAPLVLIQFISFQYFTSLENRSSIQQVSMTFCLLFHLSHGMACTRKKLSWKMERESNERLTVSAPSSNSCHLSLNLIKLPRDAKCQLKDKSDSFPIN